MVVTQAEGAANGPDDASVAYIHTLLPWALPPRFHTRAHAYARTRRVVVYVVERGQGEIVIDTQAQQFTAVHCS